MTKDNKNLTEAQLVSKAEPQNQTHPTLADVIAAVISFGDVAYTAEIDRTHILNQTI